MAKKKYFIPMHQLVKFDKETAPYRKEWGILIAIAVALILLTK